MRKRWRLLGLVAVAIGAMLGYLTAAGKLSSLLSADAKDPAVPAKAVDAGPAPRRRRRRVRLAAAAGPGESALSADAVGERRRPHDAGLGVQAAGRAAAPAQGRAEHPHRADRRRRAGPGQHLRRVDQHADDGPHRQAAASPTTASTPRPCVRPPAPRSCAGGTSTASPAARSPSWPTTGTATPASSPKAAPRWPRC